MNFATLSLIVTLALLIAIYGEPVNAYSAKHKDISWEFGDWGFKKCRANERALPAEEKAKLKRGICETLRDLLEDEIEVTGTALADSMDVGFDETVGKNLRKDPWKGAGRRAIEDLGKWALKENTNDSQKMKGEMVKWFAGWILKASASDTSLNMPGAHSGIDVEKLMANARAQQAAEGAGEADEL